MSYNWKCCSFYPNNFDASALIMQEMKKTIGLDFMKICNQANTDEVVEGYLEELKLLFAYHGSQYAVGEHHEHEDATKDSYANDTYINAGLEKNGNYTISCEVVSVIPKETVKEVMGGLMGAITEGLKGKKTDGRGYCLQRVWQIRRAVEEKHEVGFYKFCKREKLQLNK